MRRVTRKDIGRQVYSRKDSGNIVANRLYTIREVSSTGGMFKTDFGRWWLVKGCAFLPCGDNWVLKNKERV